MMEFLGKVALVTGAGAGIGEAIALAFAREGARIIVNDIQGDDADRTASRILASGAEALAVQADVSDKDAIDAMVAVGLERFGTIDILVNNAGIGGSSILVKDMPVLEWKRSIAVNLNGPFYCCRAVIPGMIERGGGKIVNIASLAAQRMSKLGGAEYTAAKYGLVGLSHHLAFEVASYGINVNVICPGATLTPLVKSKTTESFRSSIAGQIPLGRWISPEDIAETALFLSSDRASMITGEEVGVNGGQLLGIASDYREDLQRRFDTSRQRLRDYLERKEGTYE
jgi:NAD(P)-dependent dehydrogenase (short-subunit alcohol dehydrogenase family)